MKDSWIILGVRRKRLKNLSDNLDHVFEKLKNPERGIETGFYQLDDMLLGFKASELIVVAGRPSMGKTSLMSDFVLHAGKSVPVVVFSAEMSFQTLAERLVANLADLNLHSLKKAGLNKATTPAITKAMADLKTRQITIDDTSYLTPLIIRNKLKQVNAGCVFIDYLQLLGADMSTGRSYEDIGNITRDLKAAAKELCLPVILLCQLNRESSKTETHEPKLSYLRDSGKIEENADIVLLVHRPDYYDIKEVDIGTKDRGDAFVIVAKNRSGPVGKCPVTWVSEYMSFRDFQVETF